MIAYTDRLKRFREAMEDRGWNGALLTPGGDLQYLIGIRRKAANSTETHMHGDWLAGALLTPERCTLVVPHLARGHVEPQAVDKPWIDEVIHIDEGADLPSLARELFSSRVDTSATLALPRQAMAETPIRLASLFPGLDFACAGDILAPMRAVKEPGELRAMEAAAATADLAFTRTLEHLRPGMTEWQIAMEVDAQLRESGAEGTSFATGIMIRGAGCRDIPVEAGGSEDNTLQPGRVLAFDFGAVVDGYCSDFGRTVFVGDPDPELLRIHDLIVEAQTAGMRALRPGAVASDVDRAARTVIEDAGYGEGFFHRLGHGIGVDVHEPPFLAVGRGDEIREDMCFTVEPSVTIPGRCFIRIEDVVRVRADGAVKLNGTPSDPVII
ncbi:MAG: Xaa-Pro peptidase family protein [Bacillota bacterium]